MPIRRQSGRSLRDEALRALDADLGTQARLAARRITAVFDRALAASALTHAQFGLMCLIASAADDTVGALAVRAGVDPSTMSRNLEPLVAAGLVEVVTAEADRRRRAVWLTEAGIASLQGALPVWRAAQGELESTLGGSLCARLARSAERLAKK